MYLITSLSFVSDVSFKVEEKTLITNSPYLITNDTSYDKAQNIISLVSNLIMPNQTKIIPSRIPPIEYKPGDCIKIKKYIHPLDFPGVDVQELNLKIPIHDQRVLKAILPTNYQIVFFSSAAIREFTRLYHFKNALVTYMGVFCKDCQVKFPNDHVGVDTSSITVSNRVIENLIIGKTTFIPWGHFLTDSPISSLLYLPEEIVNKSQYYFYKESFFYGDNLKAFGWGHLQRASLYRDATLVKNLYMAVPNDFVNGQTYFFRLLRERLMKLYKCEDIKPTQGTISNKGLYKPRHISNMDKLIERIRETYPNITWTYHSDDQISNTAVAIKILSATKYFVTPCGSAAFKILYMHENTGICIVGMAITDWANLGICQAMGIWCTYSYNPTLPWLDRSTGIIDIEMNLRFLSYLIYAVDNQKWPTVTKDKVEFLFEQDMHRKILDIDPSSSLQIPCNIDKYYDNLIHHKSQPKRCESIKSIYFDRNVPMR
ncbi:hypothetical protein TVAG_142430 [Trichomonas vaginalis G3]|uniref:Glycosyltransferase 61 catalytic domain-containing protein n=1 Tax=Trichomonas vaginalis (strain ATCC PRA-98 / G3) TaxID=412133 RepID=A2EHK2_TRIV3|nr:glycosyltransferase family [Trichomonas vaginalis G3]EAY07889.1 hypothetical protein TVAG_142430 [Trichomonas vaginalis G3]KAI5514148.1 glycosyltransferase family [Trichomonas vaginalis G3]|eukprot:XP_001320112.1 hypothetical protein [Trichomonas vaginalis G3]